MVCPVCQKEVSAQASFCNYCGANLASAAAASGTPYTPPFTPVGSDVPPPPSSAAYSTPPPADYAAPHNYPPTGYPPPAAATSGLSPNLAAALAYVTIIPAIVFLILEPYNRIPLVRFHSLQSLALFVVAVILQIAVSAAQVMLHFIPLSFIILGLVHMVLSLVLFIFWLVAIIKASRGEWYKLPVIGDFADRQARS